MEARCGLQGRATSCLGEHLASSFEGHPGSDTHGKFYKKQGGGWELKHTFFSPNITTTALGTRRDLARRACGTSCPSRWQPQTRGHVHQNSKITAPDLSEIRNRIQSPEGQAGTAAGLHRARNGRPSSARAPCCLPCREVSSP